MTQQMPTASIYTIVVEGHLSSRYQALFDGLTSTQDFDPETGRPVTVLTGPLPDLPALYGLLAHLRDLNINLLSVQVTRSHS